MALYNELLAGRFNEALVKLFGMKQPAPAPQLAGEVSPVLEIGTPPPENRYLAQEQLRVGYAVAPAAVAQNSGVMMFNPVGSNTLAVVDELLAYSSDAAQTFLVALVQGDAAWTLATTHSVRDARLFGATAYPFSSAIRFLQTNNAASLAQPGAIASALAATMVRVPGSWVVTPGYSLRVVGLGQNNGVTAVFSYRQRAMLPSEF